MSALKSYSYPFLHRQPPSQGNLYTWDTDTGTVAHMYEAGHKGPVQFAQVYNLPSYGRCVVSCGAKDHTVVVWDLLSGEPRALIEIKELEHAKNLRCGQRL